MPLFSRSHTSDSRVSTASRSLYFSTLPVGVTGSSGTISTHDVEQALLAHPAVSAAAVVGVPSELGEEEVMAFVVGAVEPEELLRSCEPRLPYFAVPRYVEVVRELPLTPTGKVEKYKLRERGVGSTTWDAEAEGYRPPR